MEQWKVKTSDGYQRTFSKFQGAKRDYGIICKSMEEEEDDSPDWVKMFYREDIQDKWKCMEDFTLAADHVEDEDDE